MRVATLGRTRYGLARRGCARHGARRWRARRAGARRWAGALAPLALLLAALAWPGRARAATHEVCVRWRVDAIDRTAGTLPMTTDLLWAARGTRIRITHTTGTVIVPNARTSTGTGCYSFFVAMPPPPLPNIVYRNVRVYYDAIVGNPERIPVRGFDSFNAHDNNVDQSILVTSVPFELQSNGTYKGTAIAGQGQHDMAISMAAVTHTLHWVDAAMSSNKPSAPPQLRVIHSPCPGSGTPGFSCLDPTNGHLRLSIGNGSTKRKFVLGHETGHWLDYHWGGQTGKNASSAGSAEIIYGYKSDPTEHETLAQPCRFTWASNGGQGVYAHAMRSQEFQRGAVREGFAHFMALVAFNVASATTDPQFQYYKAQEPGPHNGNYPANERYFVAGLTGSSGTPIPHGYLSAASGCNCTALGNCARTSTELQWMRAYWWYLHRNEPGGTKPTLTQWFGQVQASLKVVTIPAASQACGPTVDRCFMAMKNAVGSEFEARWEAVGTQMNLKTDQP